MKKIIALFVFMLAFGLTANAQQKKAATASAAATTVVKADAEAIKKAAVKDVAAMKEVIELNAQDQQSMLGLMEYKHRNLQENPGFSAERKAALSQTIEAKLRATLNADQMEKLSKMPDLMKRLTN